MIFNESQQPEPTREFKTSELLPHYTAQASVGELQRNYSRIGQNVEIQNGLPGVPLLPAALVAKFELNVA